MKVRLDDHASQVGSAKWFGRYSAAWPKSGRADYSSHVLHVNAVFVAPGRSMGMLNRQQRSPARSMAQAMVCSYFALSLFSIFSMTIVCVTKPA